MGGGPAATPVRSTKGKRFIEILYFNHLPCTICLHAALLYSCYFTHGNMVESLLASGSFVRRCRHLSLGSLKHTSQDVAN